MKRLIVLLAVGFISVALQAQNKIDYYEYWYDANYASKVSSAITPVEYFQLNTTVPTTGLSEGLHTVHFRFRDQNSKFSSILSSFFLKQGNTPSASNVMASYEYWFDNGYATKVAGSLPSNQFVNFANLVTTTGLSQGLHTFHIRFKDAAGKWSSVLSQFFLKQGSSIGSATPQLTQYQYWFDSNFASAQSISLPGGQYEQVVSAIDALALTNGLHTIHLRFKDASGKWSSVLSQFFMKQESTAALTPQLIEYQYWFDNDYASAVNTALSGAQYETIISNLDATGISTGLHTLHIRFKDASAKWSSVLSGFFIKNQTTSVLNNEITAYRYWFDENDAAMVTEMINTPEQYVNVLSEISMVTIPKGTHTIHFQFKDAQGMWSSVTNDTIYKNSLPIASFSADNTTFCDNGTVNFDNTSIDGDDFIWDFGDGNTSTDSLAVHTYTAPGDYTVSLTAIDPLVPIDSTTIISQLIHVYETPDPTISLNGNDSICVGTSVILSTAPNASYLWSDNSSNPSLEVSQAGIYSVTVYNLDNPACYASSGDVEIYLMPLPDASFTYSNVDHLVSFTNTSAEGDSFLWNFGDGNTAITYDATHDYQVNGVYTSYLVSYNFCGSDTAYVEIDLSYIGIAEQTVTHALKLYPNPTRSEVNILADTFMEGPISVVVTDEKGSEIQHHSFDTLNGQKIQLNLEGLMNGVYYVKITNSMGWMAIEKVIVNR